MRSWTCCLIAIAYLCGMAGCGGSDNEPSPEAIKHPFVPIEAPKDPKSMVPKAKSKK